MLEILGQKQRPLGDRQKRVLAALLDLEGDLGEGTFTTAFCSCWINEALSIDLGLGTPGLQPSAVTMR